MTLQVRRGADRAESRTEHAVTRHSLSFGAHYDPGNVAFGPLIAHNDEFVLPGPGYDWHPHRDVEIVSYVVSGTLLHEDSLGGRAHTPAGHLQLFSAGSGVEHAERSAGGQPVRFVQAWLVPTPIPDADGPPLYRQADAEAGPVRPWRQPAAAVEVVRLAPGSTPPLSTAPRVHAFVVRGRVEVPGVVELDAGDALRATDTAVAMHAITEAELLVWSMG